MKIVAFRAAALAAVTVAHATPDESGWGLNLFHQGNTEWSGFVGWLSSSAMSSGRIEGVRAEVN